ncbi:MAG: hypothetical protein O7H39_16675 [Gammaproteobacteria bacterium]|nr:hypothetical protein [Gammaproteobacteria bacterium]
MPNNNDLASVHVIEKQECIHCSQEIDSTLEACPYCGVRQEHARSNRDLYAAVLLVGGFLLLLYVNNIDYQPNLTNGNSSAVSTNVEPSIANGERPTPESPIADATVEPSDTTAALRLEATVACPDTALTCPDNHQGDMFFLIERVEGGFCGVRICMRKSFRFDATYRPLRDVEW